MPILFSSYLEQLSVRDELPAQPNLQPLHCHGSSAGVFTREDLTKSSGRTQWLFVVRCPRAYIPPEDSNGSSSPRLPFSISSSDIHGVICLTPENLERPWILFEAGALSKVMGEKTRVCPYLFGDLRAENVRPPFGMFQATRVVTEETRKLVGTVNRVLGGSLAEEKLDTLFEGVWRVLEGKLQRHWASSECGGTTVSERDMLVELLELSRGAAANSTGPGRCCSRCSRAWIGSPVKLVQVPELADVRNYLDTWLGLDSRRSPRRGRRELAGL